MKDINQLSNILEPFKWLVGEWAGMGKVSFPTHDPFSYQDSMHFKLVSESFEQEPIIHFEEMARVIENGEANFKHWETGYFKPTLDDRIEFYVSHNTGRIEITYGGYEQLDLENKSFRLVLHSDHIRNDEGTKTALSSKREFSLQNGILTYQLAMATTDVKIMTDHLTAELRRI